MRVRYCGKTDSLMLINGKIYDVVGVEKDWYRIIDELGVDEDDDLPGYLYPPGLFEIVEE